MKLKQIRVDGYKNLIKCEVNLGDFNVLVGPNNSGKSNLLEALHILGGISFGGPDLRDQILQGRTPRQTVDFSISHLLEHKNKPIKMGITFEAKVRNKLWLADYDVMIKCAVSKDEKGDIVSEILTAKPIGRHGRASKYIWRQKLNFEIITKSGRKKKHKIAHNNSCLSALPSLYPEPKSLPNELLHFYDQISQFAMTPIFAFSPSELRREMDEERPISGLWVSSFDLGLVVDHIKEHDKYYELFRETVCDIMDFDSLDFHVEVKKPPSPKRNSEATEKRMRYIIVKRQGDRPSLIEEYSDGTLLVSAILAALCSKKRSGPILCLEELETCLHPAALERLLRFLQNHSDKWPVLITTHSPYLLNGVRPEDVNVAVVDETGATHFKKVKNSKQLREYLNKNLMSFGELLATDFQGFREG